MKTFIFILLFSVVASTYAGEQSGNIENDYVWQGRFKKSMSRAYSGVAKAQYSVGEMFEKGRGTRKDIKEAVSWYEKASAQKHLKAQYKLGYLYYKGLGVQQNVDKAYELFVNPAGKGDVRAQYYLGKLYDTGQGVTKDPEKALLWYSRSSLGGYAHAEEALQKVKVYLASLETASKSNIKSNTTKSDAPSATAVAEKAQSDPDEVATTQLAKMDSLSVKILDGDWTRRQKPAEFLPSKITSCKQQSSTIVECVSGKLHRNIGNADITYITKAILFEMKKSGEFKVAYRNNVLKVDKIVQVDDEEGSDEGDNIPQKVTVKKGWQETEHELDCKINDMSAIDCVKNKTRKLKFNSNRKS